MKKIFCLILVIVGLMMVRPVMATGPLLKFSPSTGSYANGSTFVVTVGVDSGTEKSQAVDAWVTFDASKLEVESIDTVSNPPFVFTLGKNIYNSSGKFDISLASTDMSTYNATTISGDLVNITFKALATGTANVNFTCTAGSTTDSNIFNTSSNDVIDCPSNINATYTITDSGSSSDSSSTAPTSTPVPTSTSTLPSTGNVGMTIGLMVFAAVGVLSSLALRFL
jgi:hypothetical protein